jgi:predicted nucleic acid-binding protein
VILVDTSIWIDHLRSPVVLLDRLLDEGDVLSHPFVVGELGMGSIAKRADTLNGLRVLPQAIVAMDDEVQQFVERHKLFGRGFGYVDAHLLASAQLTDEALLWTRDKRLLAAAQALGLALIEVAKKPN